jgi:hypothetical protein
MIDHFVSALFKFNHLGKCILVFCHRFVHKGDFIGPLRILNFSFFDASSSMLITSCAKKCISLKRLQDKRRNGSDKAEKG